VKGGRATFAALLDLARLTVTEALRRRLAMAALVVGSIFLGFFALGLYFVRTELLTKGLPAEPGMNFITMAALYAGNFLLVMTSVLVAVDTLAGEIGSGVIETLCTKPLRRAVVLLGKWLGCAFLVAAYVSALLGGVLLVARLVGHTTPPNVGRALPLLLLEGLLLMTLAIAGGTRLSTLANGISVLGLYAVAFIGGWVEQFGTLLGSQAARYVGIVSSLLVPSESLWQRASYLMQPPLVRDLHMTPFVVASVPSPAMVVWAGVYIVAALGAAMWLFERRDL
jgi:Cu-processing system permease protein